MKWRPQSILYDDLQKQDFRDFRARSSQDLVVRGRNHMQESTADHGTNNSTDFLYFMSTWVYSSSILLGSVCCFKMRWVFVLTGLVNFWEFIRRPQIRKIQYLQWLHAREDSPKYHRFGIWGRRVISWMILRTIWWITVRIGFVGSCSILYWVCRKTILCRQRRTNS